MTTPNGTELDDRLAYPLFAKLFDDLQAKDTEIGGRVYELLNEEQFNVVLVGTNEWAFETSLYGRLPNYAYEFLKKYIPRQYGLKYVFDCESHCNL